MDVLAQIYVERGSGFAEDWQVTAATVAVYAILWGYPALAVFAAWVHRWRILAALFPKSCYQCDLCGETCHRWQKTIWRRGQRMQLEDNLCRDCWWKALYGGPL